MRLTVTMKGHARRNPKTGKRQYLHVGDTFEGSERELEVFGDRLARANGEAAEAQDGLPTGNVKTVAAAVPNLSDEDLERLAEKDDRKGVQDAIEAVRAKRADDDAD